MKKKTTIAAMILAICAFGLLGAACGAEDSETAKADLCESLGDLSSTVMTYEGLNPLTATNDQRDAAAGEIEDAWDAVLDDAEDWANAPDNELAQAYGDLYWAIQDLPGDSTVAESLEELEPELSAFPQAFSETFDQSGCASA
jgi:hypothetical protein